MEFLAQEAEHVLGGKRQRGVFEKASIQSLQVLTILEEDVGGVLGLIDDPVISAILEQAC